MAYRRPRADALLTVDEVYRKPVGPSHDPKTLYALLLRFVKWRRERNWSETTLKTQTHHQYRFILWAAERGLHYANDITLPILERYQRYLFTYRKSNGEALSSRTQRSQLGPLMVWFGWMTRSHLLLADPASGLVLPRLEKRLPRQILSVEEVEQVLALPDITTLQGVRDRALLELLWSTGMRRMEVAGLDQYAIDASRRTVTIRQGKGKKDRVVPIGERALKWMQHYQQQVRPQLLVNPEVTALFVALDGLAGLTPNGITGVTKLYILGSGLSRWGSCHLFRHAMATQMLENGADIRWIQAMLGHASLESTQIYTQVSIRALQAVHASTHPAEQSDSETPPDSEEPDAATVPPDSPQS